MAGKGNIDYLRTPEERFENLPDFPYKPHYLQNSGLRMAYIDEQVGDGSEVFLLLHGQPTWSFLYRKMIPVSLDYTTNPNQKLNRRIVAPDHFGFGRSDKPRDDAVYNFDFHRNALLRFIEQLQLKNITLVVQDWGGFLGLTLPFSDPTRYKRLLIMNTGIGSGHDGVPATLSWINDAANLPDVGDLIARLGHRVPEDIENAYRAPFPDDSYKAGVRRFPQMILIRPDMPGVETSRQAREFFEATEHFQQDDIFVAAGLQDKLMGPRMKLLASVFKNGAYYTELEDASHYVQEWGEPVAKLAIAVFEKKGDAAAGVESVAPRNAQGDPRYRANRI